MKKVTVYILFCIPIFLFVFVGCASMGARTIPKDRFNYTGAISESWKTQMLLNMVSLRYGDVPGRRRCRAKPQPGGVPIVRHTHRSGGL